MGCNESTPQGTVVEQYMKMGGHMPSPSEYYNEFEKQVYMAVNVCRFDPKRMVPHVRTAAKNPAAKTVSPDSVKSLIAHLNKMEPLPSIALNPQAMEACRKNNTRVCELDEEVPSREGNITTFKEVVGDDKNVSCEEYTMCKYESENAAEFVALELILDWAREGDHANKSPVIDRDTNSMGVSLKSHKKTINLIQCLYVKNAVNAIE